MNSFLRNTISELYNAVWAHVAATRDALAERLQGVRETASLFCDGEYGIWTVEIERHCGKRSRRAKPAATKEEEEQQQETAAAKEQQQNDDGRYDTVAKIKLVYEGNRVKEFRVTGNLNKSNTKMIMANIPHWNEDKSNLFIQSRDPSGCWWNCGLQ